MTSFVPTMNHYCGSWLASCDPLEVKSIAFQLSLLSKSFQVIKRYTSFEIDHVTLRLKFPRIEDREDYFKFSFTVVRKEYMT